LKDTRALGRWVYERGLELRLIEAAKPTKNPLVESFNGKFRDECLREQRFGCDAHWSSQDLVDTG